jgi:hypothetical protein
MRIEFERSGGFMGLRQTVVLNTDELETQEANEIQRMVEVANFFELPEETPEPSSASDQFQYRLTIEQSEESRHTVVLSDASTPEAMQPLLQRLTLLARTRR